MRAVFMDRDGTINDDPDGFITLPKDFHLFPFTAKAIESFNKLGFKTIIVTNQSGIARGLLTIKDLEAIHKYMTDELAKENAFIDLILYSPYYKKGIIEPYNIDHISRKPAPGMFHQALKKFPIEASQSYMIGDRPEDMEFGKTNGLNCILVKTGNGKKTLENMDKMKIKPDFVVENLLSAVELIKTNNGAGYAF